MHEQPTVDQLRALLMFADEGSASAAAERLGVAPCTVSRWLRIFFGRQPLLARSPNGLKLTEMGQRAVPGIRQLLGQYDQLRAYMAGRTPFPRKLTIGVGTSASQFLLAQAIVAVRQVHPDVEIQTRAARGQQRISGVADGRFDLAVVSHTALQIETEQRGLELQPLAPQDLCVIAKRESAEAAELQQYLVGQRVPLRKLAHWTLVGLDEHSGVRRQLQAALARQPVRLHFGVEAGGWLGVVHYVRRGLGVGLVPLSILEPGDRQQLEIRRLATDVQLVYHVIYRRGSDELVQEVVEQIVRAARDFQRQIKRRWNGIL